MPAQAIRLLIVDDHPAFRAGLVALLADGGEMQVVAECGDGQAAVGGVIERALEPLRRGRYRRVLQIADHIAREGGHALRAHGVSLVGHGGGAYLPRLERLVHLLEVAQKADVV